MKRNNFKLILGVTAAMLLVVSFYYYVAIYRNSLHNTAEVNIPKVETLQQSSPSSGFSGGGGGSGSGLLKP